MDATPLPTDAELAALRARAYGADPDIWDDPAALARLAELEDAHTRTRTAPGSVSEDDPPPRAPAGRAVGDPPPRGIVDAAPVTTPGGTAPGATAPGGTAPGVPGSAPAERGRGRVRWWIAAGVLTVIAAALAFGGARLLEPRPDAALAPLGMTDDAVMRDIRSAWGGSAEGLQETTFQAHESFRGIEPWSGLDDFGNPCLFLMDHAAAAPLGFACTPSSADVLIDLGAWPVLDQDFAEGLPDGSVLRFRLRDGAVDVFVHRAPVSD
jgi:hypothetical protein